MAKSQWNATVRSSEVLAKHIFCFLCLLWNDLEVSEGQTQNTLLTDLTKPMTFISPFFFNHHVCKDAFRVSQMSTEIWHQHLALWSSVTTQTTHENQHNALRTNLCSLNQQFYCAGAWGWKSNELLSVLKMRTLTHGKKKVSWVTVFTLYLP